MCNTYLFQLTASFFSKFLLLFFSFFRLLLLQIHPYPHQFIASRYLSKSVFSIIHSVSHIFIHHYIWNAKALTFFLFFSSFYSVSSIFLTINLSIAQNRFIKCGQLGGGGEGVCFIWATINCNLTGASDFGNLKIIVSTFFLSFHIILFFFFSPLYKACKRVPDIIISLPMINRTDGGNYNSSPLIALN